MSLRIAYLTSQYPATSHTFISREVAALRDLGVHLETFSIRPPGPSELADESIAREAARTFTVLKQPLPRFLSAQVKALFGSPRQYLRTLALALRHRPSGLRPGALALAHFAEALLLAAELKRRGIDRLHNHFANSGATVGYLAASFANIPWSFTMHGISETDYPAGLTLGSKIQAAHFVACVSYFGRAQAMRVVSPEHWDKLQIVRCGLALKSLPARPAREGDLKLICVGRLSPEKGQSGLLRAFADLCRDAQSDLQLILVGDGPDRDQLRADAKAFGVTDRVHFAGRLSEDDTLRQIASADMLVLPSFMEGLPIVLMEAMAVGTSVLASRVAGIPELVEDGINGLLFTPSKWDELADRMRAMVADGLLRDRLAVAGREAIFEGFDIVGSAHKMLSLFEDRLAA